MLSGSVQDLVAEYLPGYQEARERWPLWTYERGRRAAGSTWRGAGSWPDRLRWSQRIPLLAIRADVIASFRNAGVEPFGFFPHQAHVAVGINDQPAGRGEIVPLHRARIATLFAVTAHPAPPETVKQIRIPDKWTQRQWLDDVDYHQLAEQLVVSLFEPADLPLLRRFLELADQAGKKTRRKLGRKLANKAGKKRSKLRKPGRKLSAEGSRLSEELARSAGLLPGRRGPQRNVIAQARMEQLELEATEIVKHAHSWCPSDAELGAVRAAYQAAEIVTTEQDRRRHESQEEQENRLARMSTQLHLPFLTPFELETIARGGSNPRSVALKLIRLRMVADISMKTLQNLLPRPSI